MFSVSNLDTACGCALLQNSVKTSPDAEDVHNKTKSEPSCKSIVLSCQKLFRVPVSAFIIELSGLQCPLKSAY